MSKIICTACKTEIMIEEVMSFDHGQYHPECYHKKYGQTS